MSVCDECPGSRWKIQWCAEMCGMEMHENKMPWCVMGVLVRPDTCPFANILRALPSASEEQRETATKALSGDYDPYTSMGGRANLHPGTIVLVPSPEIREAASSKGGDESE